MFAYLLLQAVKILCHNNIVYRLAVQMHGKSVCSILRCIFAIHNRFSLSVFGQLLLQPLFR